MIIDSSEGLSSSVDWHLRNKEHFAKAFENLEVDMLILTCWLYNVCLLALLTFLVSAKVAYSKKSQSVFSVVP